MGQGYFCPELDVQVVVEILGVAGQSQANVFIFFFISFFCFFSSFSLSFFAFFSFFFCSFVLVNDVSPLVHEPEQDGFGFSPLNLRLGGGGDGNI